MRHSLLSSGLILGVSTGAYAEVPFTQPRSPGPYGELCRKLGDGVKKAA
jgi:hypothetical protein